MSLLKVFGEPLGYFKGRAYGSILAHEEQK